MIWNRDYLHTHMNICMGCHILISIPYTPLTIPMAITHINTHTHQTYVWIEYVEYLGPIDHAVHENDDGHYTHHYQRTVL
ncbi:hypothetical protein EON63_25150 [archaeon]|nr:MAG: hypothetical protein EON63_25150 [archaeon]